MKKFIAILSMVCFVALTSYAQQPETAPTETKKEASVNKSDDSAAPASKCKTAGKSCCKSKGKEEASNGSAKAGCCSKSGSAKAKAGCDHGGAKADVSDAIEESVKPNNK